MEPFTATNKTWQAEFHNQKHRWVWNTPILALSEVTTIYYLEDRLRLRVDQIPLTTALDYSYVAFG